MKLIALILLCCCSIRAGEFFPVTMNSWVDASDGVVTLWDKENDGNGKYTFSVAEFPWPGSTRKNPVMSIGYNAHAGGAVDYTEWSCMFTIEPFYAPRKGDEYIEIHSPQLWSPNSQRVLRPLSWIIDRNTDRIEGGIHAAKFSFFDQSYTQRIIFSTDGCLHLVNGSQVYVHGAAVGQINCITQIDFSAQKVKRQTLTVIHGIATALSAESDWE